MSPKVFITGATGFIGGEVFYTISEAHPDWEITALVRSSDKGALLAAAFPKTRLVYGSLDDVDVIEQEAKGADLVLNCASSDHAPALSAIISGLTPHKGHLIHTSGTGLLLYDDITLDKVVQGTKLSSRVYTDTTDIAKILSFPVEAPHRPTDILTLDSHALGIRPAIICPPTIYGETRGPARGPSVQIPGLCRASLKQGQAIRVNEGLAYWSNVHVKDLGDLYLRLAEAALQEKDELFGNEAYYFAEDGEHIWKDVSKMVATEGKKLGAWETAEVKSLSVEEIDAVEPRGSYLIGTNSRSRAVRARELLGWKPTGPKLEETVGQTLKNEALKMNLKVGHAAKAAGD